MFEYEHRERMGKMVVFVKLYRQIVWQEEYPLSMMRSQMKIDTAIRDTQTRFAEGLGKALKAVQKPNV